MSTKPPPVPPDNQSHKGLGRAEPATSDTSKASPSNSEKKGQQGTAKINTTIADISRASEHLIQNICRRPSSRQPRQQPPAPRPSGSDEGSWIPRGGLDERFDL